MSTSNNKRKYVFSVIGVIILCLLVGGVFYALMFGKEVLQATVGDIGTGKGVVIQFDLQQIKGLVGIVEPQ